MKEAQFKEPPDSVQSGNSFSSLEHLFGSRTRVKLLSLFLMNPQRPFFVRELTREIEAQINSVRRELLNLAKLGLIVISEHKEEDTGGLKEKKFFILNQNYVLTSELASLFTKARVLAERDLVEKIKALDNLLYFVLTGFFVGHKGKTDMLLVGQLDKTKLSHIVSGFEKELRREVNYTLMSPTEYQYRREITDKFLYDIQVNKKIEVVNLIDKPKKAVA
ncbi:hypothetical protein HY224_02040 [Candidatus Uhrbacteria bacterium]|nr:hypothetical protein [Candidatus Uhrbacteria bacterium]